MFNSRENNRLVSKKGKKRAQSAIKRGLISAPQNKRLIVNFAGVSKYANPGERPQHKKVPKVNKDVIMTRLSSDNKALLNALAPKRGQSAFMRKANKPLIKNQLKEDLLSTFM